MDTQTTDPRPPGIQGQTCATCGGPADKISSGRLECWRCWDWRKLDGPAAAYWISAIENLFSNDAGTAPDYHDYETWSKWGVRDEVVFALEMLIDLRGRYIAARDDNRVRRGIRITEE